MPRVTVRVLSFPIRLDRTGAIAGVEQGSDVWIEECIAQAMLTQPGERDLVPAFGVDDPAFALFQVAALQRHLADFGPEITVTSAEVQESTDGKERVVIDWVRAETSTEGALEP